MIAEHLQFFLNKSVGDFSPSTGIADPETTVYRISIDYDQYENGERISGKLEEFSQDPKAGTVTELIIGAFNFDSSESTAPIISKLVELKDTFKSLKAIFIADIIVDECEISWIQQSDFTPLLEAYPLLEHLQIRGGDGLTFSQLAHDHLRTLIIETGGLPPNVVTSVNAARLPNLQRLDLWLGSDNYGFDSKIEDFNPLLSGKVFPQLKHLGLMNSEIQDEIAIAVAKAPVIEQLKVLDLSMGTLTDVGAAALLASPPVWGLDFLNLRHHFMSDEMMSKLNALGIRINMDDQETSDEEDYRYAEVTE